jgi:uncharacterized membrane protein YbaN (DUF454 family)
MKFVKTSCDLFCCFGYIENVLCKNTLTVSAKISDFIKKIGVYLKKSSMCVRVRSNFFKQRLAKAPKFGKSATFWQRQQSLTKSPRFGNITKRLPKAPRFGKSTAVWQTHQSLSKASTKLLGKVPDYHLLVKIKKIN